ncbi:MAG: universal stress protein [Acidimicrobiales bacterium]|jgi:nucleotide-binding universal stress UspA family protein
MFSTIVVGTDGSETARAAVALAVEIARQDGATLHVLHVVKDSPAAMPVAQVGPGVVVMGDSVKSNAVGAVADPVLAAAVAEAQGVAVQTHAAGGDPADAMVQLAEHLGADLIVVGSKGMRGARRIIGSVPNSVAHSAPCDVLIAKTS